MYLSRTPSRLHQFHYLLLLQMFDVILLFTVSGIYLLKLSAKRRM